MSKPLNVLVHGHMKEAADGVAVWSQYDEETFVRFWQFAYTGDYTAAKPEIVPTPQTQSGDCDETVKEPSPEDYPEPPPEPEPEPEPEYAMYDEPVMFDGFAYSRGTKKGKGTFTGPPKRDQLWKQFKKLDYDVPPPPPSSEELPSPSLMDHSEVFLSHARIYVLADYYDIEGLVVLSLKKLHRALINFELSRDRVDDVATVLDYCYANTVDKGGNQDRLRHLLTLYTACKVETMWPSTYFQEILERSGELSKAVIKNMLDRLD